ncbi:LuxR C-terminal-related transcriptional regulator [Streptomyces sp. SID2888]|uniref:helix-turn-helix transcriptional regulator n=1 Tax=Streptomyces sp. SID2888 TaxID=2690256 RepID=UPI001927D9FD|nr:LuxR C-terminal-related transcriptional regulator [Streptomyces sp. SID2888]
MEAADHARRLQSQLSALALHSAAPEGGAPDVEEITSPGRGRALLDSVATLAKRQIRVIQPSVVARHLILDWLSDERYGREEGVEVRTIHQSSLLQSARAVSYLESLTRRRVQVRIAPLLPFRLIVVDETFGVVCPPGTMLLIRQSALLQLLSRMFEFCWNDARDLSTALLAHTPHPPGPAGTRVAPALSEQQIVILRLWAKGRQDAAIARELQVSPRTLRRMVSALLRRLEVSSRFEAGVVAARTHRLLDAEDPLHLPS